MALSKVGVIKKLSSSFMQIDHVHREIKNHSEKHGEKTLLFDVVEVNLFY